MKAFEAELNELLGPKNEVWASLPTADKGTASIVTASATKLNGPAGGLKAARYCLRRPE